MEAKRKPSDKAPSGGQKRAKISTSAMDNDPEIEAMQSEAKRLRAIAIRGGLFSQHLMEPTQLDAKVRKRVARELIDMDQKDIVRKPSTKSRYLISFPGMLDIEDRKGELSLGTLSQLDTSNPCLYIDYPQGRMKLKGYRQNLTSHIISMECRPMHLGVADQFDHMIVFSEVSWIGTLEDNPEEKPLPVPPAVQLKLKVQEPLKQQGVTMSRLSKPSSRLKGVESGLSEANPSSLKEGPTPAKRSSARMSDLPKKSYKDSDCDTESDGSDNHESGDNCKHCKQDSVKVDVRQSQSVSNSSGVSGVWSPTLPSAQKKKRARIAEENRTSSSINSRLMTSFMFKTEAKKITDGGLKSDAEDKFKTFKGRKSFSDEIVQNQNDQVIKLKRTGPESKSTASVKPESITAAKSSAKASEFGSVSSDDNDFDDVDTLMLEKAMDDAYAMKLSVDKATLRRSPGRKVPVAAPESITKSGRKTKVMSYTVDLSNDELSSDDSTMVLDEIQAQTKPASGKAKVIASLTKKSTSRNPKAIKSSPVKSKAKFKTTKQIISDSEEELSVGDCVKISDDSKGSPVRSVTTSRSGRRSTAPVSYALSSSDDENELH